MLPAMCFFGSDAQSTLHFFRSPSSYEYDLLRTDLTTSSLPVVPNTLWPSSLRWGLRHDSSEIVWRLEIDDLQAVEHTLKVYGDVLIDNWRTPNDPHPDYDV